MNFSECINNAVEIGKLGAKKGAEAVAAYEDAKASALAEGVGESVAESQAAMKAVEEITTLNSAKRWERVHELRKSAALVERLNSMPKIIGKFYSALDQLMEETKYTYKATFDLLAAQMPEVLENFKPRYAGIYQPIENEDNILRYIYGDKVGPEVASMGEAAKNVVEMSRLLTNAEGASIPADPHYRVPQTHDRGRVAEAGKAQWVSDHLNDGVLDWSIMRYQGKEIPVDQRQEILEKVFDSIVTEGNNKGPGVPNQTTMAARLSRERFLYYNTADSWLDMNKKYGTGGFYHQLIAHIDLTARNVSIMRQFGPNVSTGKAFLERLFKNKVAELQTANPAKTERLSVNRDNALTRFQDQYDIHTRAVNVGAGDALAQVANNARSLIGTSALGGAVVNSFGDAFFGMWARGIHGMPGWHVIPNYLHAIANNKALSKQMINNGIMNESFVSMALSAQRDLAALDGGKLVRKISEVNYRAQGAAGLNQMGRGIAGNDLGHILAFVQGKKFDDIPFVAQLRNLGITERDWELVRGTPLYTPEYYHFGKGQFLRPIDMFKHANTDEMTEAANKFLMFQQAMVSGKGGLTPGNALRAEQMLGGASTGLARQVLKTMSQFMIFPSSIMFNYWPLIMQAPRFRDKAWRTFTFLAYTTVAGALIATTKDLIMGKGVPDYTDPKFYARSMMLGGGGAILGDFIYNNVNSANSGYGASTPSESEWNRFLKLTVGDPYRELATDEEVHWGKDAADFAWGLIPKPVPYKLLLERMIMDPFLEWSDPSAYQRKINAQHQLTADTGQTFWWGTGESPIDNDRF